MNSTPQAHALDNTLTSRYECKYLIDRRAAEAVRRMIRPHVRLDPHSAGRDDRRYPVLSLYLDSPGLRLYRDTAQGMRNRYKLRLRYYEEAGESPVFCEVKKRSDVIVRKARERVSRVWAEDFLSGGCLPIPAGGGADLGEFLHRCRRTDARPALRLRYMREAWESRGGDPVRITFDSDLEHSLLSDPSLAESRPSWQSTPIDSHVILEVKFTDLRPSWLDRMLTGLQLDKVSVAKYALSIEEVLGSGQRISLGARMQRPATSTRTRSAG